MQALDATRTAAALVFLIYASWSDYKTREVSDTVWMLLAPLAFALTFSEIYTYEFSQLPIYGICFALTATLAITIFYSGGFGGADAKALMCLAIALPFYPRNLLNPLSGETSLTSQILFPLTVFSNSVLLAAMMAVVIFLYNVSWHWTARRKLFAGQFQNETIGRKILIMITGYKASINKLKEKWHVYPLEDIKENNKNEFKRELLIIPKDESRNAVVARLEKAVEAGVIEDGVWATPGLPFLIFVTMGLVLALFLGDLVWIFVRFLLQ